MKIAYAMIADCYRKCFVSVCLLFHVYFTTQVIALFRMSSCSLNATRRVKVSVYNDLLCKQSRAVLHQLLKIT